MAIVELLAEALGVNKSHIELVGGATSREKRLIIRGIAPKQLAERIARL